MRSFNFNMVLNNFSQLKHIQVTKHMHYCIQKIYHVYYTTQWNFIILRKFSHMTLTSPNEKWMRVADIVRHFCHFLLWRGEFCFDIEGNFEFWITPNWQNWLFLTFESLTLHLFFLDSVIQCYLHKTTTCSDVIGACA